MPRRTLYIYIVMCATFTKSRTGQLAVYVHINLRRRSPSHPSESADTFSHFQLHRMILGRVYRYFVYLLYRCNRRTGTCAKTRATRVFSFSIFRFFPNLRPTILGVCEKRFPVQNGTITRRIELYYTRFYLNYVSHSLSLSLFRFYGAFLDSPTNTYQFREVRAPILKRDTIKAFI